MKYSVNCESQWRCITQTCSCGRRDSDCQKPSHPLAAHMLTAHPSSYCCARDKISLFWQCYQTSQSIIEKQIIQQSHWFSLKSITKTTLKESQSWISHRHLLLNIYRNNEIPLYCTVSSVRKLADKDLHLFSLTISSRTTPKEEKWLCNCILISKMSFTTTSNL